MQIEVKMSIDIDTSDLIVKAKYLKKRSKDPYPMIKKIVNSFCDKHKYSEFITEDIRKEIYQEVLKEMEEENG